MQVEHLPYQIDEVKSKNHFYETNWKITALKLLSKHVKKQNGMTLLDYGCGRGETMKFASKSGFKVSGADIDDTCLNLSKPWGETFKIKKDSEDITNIFGDNTFDVVSSFHVLEHVPNPSSVLRQLCQLSNKYILLAVPNLRQLHGLTHNPGSISVINSGHLHGWDHDHLLNMATLHADLKLVSWTADATILPVVSHLIVKTFGTQASIKLETGLFKKIFPYHSISIIGLFEKT